jgi:hypothetical protein
MLIVFPKFLKNSASFFCSEISVLAKAYLEQKDFEKVESNAKSVYEKAVGMKYRWAEGKLKKIKD